MVVELELPRGRQYLILRNKRIERMTRLLRLRRMLRYSAMA
jgi:hypothetical protein